MSVPVNPVYLLDSLGLTWLLGITDDGRRQATKINGPTGATSVLLHDVSTNQSWLVGINTIGEWTLTLSTGGIQSVIQIVSPGGLLYNVQVSAGQFQQVLIGQYSPTYDNGYPSLEDVMNLVRLYLNDWQPGLTNTPGEGQITTDNTSASPQTLTALNSAIRELYRELRNVGDPTLIRDNVQAQLPVNGQTGPSVQTCLSFSGYFDGNVLQPSPTLPSDLICPVELWEQQTGSQLPFVPMRQPQFGLSSPMLQTFALGEWEWRGGGPVGIVSQNAGGDALWFYGSISPVTIRMRYLARMTQFAGITGPVQFSNSYIPIMDCQEAVAAKAAYKIGRVLSGMTPGVADLKENAQEAMFQLRNAVARRAQTVGYHRIGFMENGGNFSNNNFTTF
jgi:hypothetical protein